MSEQSLPVVDDELVLECGLIRFGHQVVEAGLPAVDGIATPPFLLLQFMFDDQAAADHRQRGRNPVVAWSCAP